MPFYDACVDVAESIGLLMNAEQMESFVRAVSSEHRYVLGMWINHHLLPHNTYLSEALAVLGMATDEEKSMFLIEFSQQYWRLRRAELL